MNTPDHLRYTKSHEWVLFADDGTAKVGLTDHAQDALGDLVFVNLPQVDDSVAAGDTLADVESVKAVSDVYSPVSGRVVEVNEELLDAPQRINEAHMRAGVTLLDPAQAYISPQTVIGQDTVIYPGVILEGECRIGSGCTLYQGSRLVDSAVGDGTTVENSVLQSASVGRESKIGPYAFLRPGAAVGDGCRVGDFVELKNCSIGNKSKVSHLAYVGDADVGSGCNIGCGVVFVNYDGKHKFRSKIGDNVFVGSNSNLVARGV